MRTRAVAAAPPGAAAAAAAAAATTVEVGEGAGSTTVIGASESPAVDDRCAPGRGGFPAEVRRREPASAPPETDDPSGLLARRAVEREGERAAVGTVEVEDSVEGVDEPPVAALAALREEAELQSNK